MLPVHSFNTYLLARWLLHSGHYATSKEGPSRSQEFTWGWNYLTKVNSFPKILSLLNNKTNAWVLHKLKPTEIKCHEKSKLAYYTIVPVKCARKK